MIDKNIKQQLLDRLIREMEDEDKDKLFSISVSKVSPVQVADSFEEGKKVIEGMKEGDKKPESAPVSVEESDDEMFKDLLRKKGKKIG